MTRCYIGNNSESVELNRTQQRRSQPFYGQLGQFMLLEDCLNSNEVSRIFELGKNLKQVNNIDKYVLIVFFF